MIVASTYDHLDWLISNSIVLIERLERPEYGFFGLLSKIPFCITETIFPRAELAHYLDKSDLVYGYVMEEVPDKMSAQSKRLAKIYSIALILVSLMFSGITVNTHA